MKQLQQRRKLDFEVWMIENKNKALLVLLIYQLSILAIGIINFPYIDDASRQIDGATGFAEHYSRWGSEFASWLVQGSRHLTDMGLVTHILTGGILTLASLIAIYTLNDKKISWLTAVASTLIGLNPWFLQCISFRFDSPYMALSVLVSFLPFLWWNEKKKFFILSILCIFFMCNTYQSSSGIYIVMVLTLALKELLDGEAFKPLLNKVLLGAAGYVIAMIGYFLETKLNPSLELRGGVTDVANLGEIPTAIMTNISTYFSVLLEQSTRIWILLFLFLIILFVLSCIVYSKVPVYKSLFLTVLYLFLAFVFSYGVFLIFPTELSILHPRYSYGFGVLAGILLIRFTVNFNKDLLTYFSKGILCLFLYYLLSFPFIYAATLYYQNESFSNQSQMLATDLKNYITKNRKTVYMNFLFRDSLVYQNNKRNYPILDKLVPKNNELYWPNIRLFNTYTGLGANVQAFDFSKFKASERTAEVTTYYYNIYLVDNNIYVLMKSVDLK